MKIGPALYFSVAALTLGAVMVPVPSQLQAQAPSVAIDNDNIGGVVIGPKGPEAGVWVIAETTDLPTKYAKIVVTDDQGRYVLPDLPMAKYKFGCAVTASLIHPRSTPSRAVNST